jgi:hypothetical protein
MAAKSIAGSASLVLGQQREDRSDVAQLCLARTSAVNDAAQTWCEPLSALGDRRFRRSAWQFGIIAARSVRRPGGQRPVVSTPSIASTREIVSPTVKRCLSFTGVETGYHLGGNVR